MIRRPTNHENRMIFLDLYQRGWSVDSIGESFHTKPMTVRTSMARVLELAWEIENRKGKCPGIRELKKMGALDDLVYAANKHSNAIERRYGRRGKAAESKAAPTRQKIHPVSVPPVQNVNAIKRFADWLGRLAS